MARTIDKDGKVVKEVGTKTFVAIQTERQQVKVSGQVVDSPCGVEVVKPAPIKPLNPILPTTGAASENL